MKCSDPGCGAEVVLIERYHSRMNKERNITARWRLQNGEWKAENEGGYYDEGTHFHIFCFEDTYVCFDEVFARMNGAEFEGADEEYELAYNEAKEEILDERGHEFKYWANELPLELYQIVFPNSDVEKEKRRRAKRERIRAATGW